MAILTLAPGARGAIDFGANPPGEKHKFVMFVASRPTSVTARIDGGTDRFHVASLVCQAVFTQELTPEEIALLPPHMHDNPPLSIERTVVGTSNGITALTIDRDQELVVNVTFHGEDRAGAGVQSATLIIAATGSDPISIPLSALVGEVKADLPATTLEITQGEAAEVTVPVQSTFGPDTTVRFEMDSDGGLSMLPVSVFVPRGGQALIRLRIEAARFAHTIKFNQTIRMLAFDGQQLNFLTLACEVLPAPPPIEHSPSHAQPIKPDWWQWRGANARNETWKKDYFVSGEFTNKGGSNIQDLSITIFELFEEPENFLLHEANLGSTEHAVVAPARSAPGAVPPITKEWQWFVPALWIVKGPTHREFRYKALISATDVNGNPYEPVTPVQLRVIVNVPKIKRTAAAMAMGHAAAAAALLATIFFAGAAAVAYAAASAAGAVALDPPEPDPNFRAHVPLPPLGDVPAVGPERNLILLFRLSERIMQIELTKSLIEGRRLGARAAGDEQWVNNHAQDLIAATAMQRDLANDVRRIQPQAHEDIQSHSPSSDEVARERDRLKASGLSTELANRMQLAADQRPGLDALLRSEVAVSDGDVVLSVEAALAPLTEFVDSLD